MPEPRAGRLPSSTLTLSGWCPCPAPPHPHAGRLALCGLGLCSSLVKLLSLTQEDSWGGGTDLMRAGSGAGSWPGWDGPSHRPPQPGKLPVQPGRPPSPRSVRVLSPLRRHTFRGLSGGQHPVAAQTVSVSESQT